MCPKNLISLLSKLLLVLLFASTVSGKLYYNITLDNSGYGESINEVYLVDIANADLIKGDYNYTLFGFNNSVLDARMLEAINNTIYAPFHNRGRSIQLQHDEKMYYEVGFYASLCGDRVCQYHESYFSCKTDCKSGRVDGYCDKLSDGRCDRDCAVPLDPDCGEQQKFNCNYNGICEKNENKQVCPEDCLSSKYCMVLKDGYCDPDCPVIDLDCFCGDNKCQSFENHVNCEQDCSSLNYSMLKHEEKPTNIRYEYLIPVFILFVALLLFFYNEIQLKRNKNV